MKVVELRNVTKRFGGLAAVDGVSLEVRRGQIVSLLGPSGCGKTTTLRLIAGFESPDEGTVLIGGMDVRGKRPYERNVGLLFQDYALFPHMTVEQNIAYGMRHRGIERSAIPGNTAEMLRLVKLDGFEKRWPNQLSGGQQQRVALARALATKPDVMLLDEPLSALDAKLRQELRIELKEILTSVGTTSIVVTHDQEEAMSMAEHVIVQNRGRIIQQGTPYDIYARPSNEFVAEFVGRSNAFRGRLGDEVAPGLRAFETTEGFGLVVPGPTRLRHRAAPGLGATGTNFGDPQCPDASRGRRHTRQRHRRCRRGGRPARIRSAPHRRGRGGATGRRDRKEPGSDGRDDRRGGSADIRCGRLHCPARELNRTTAHAGATVPREAKNGIEEDAYEDSGGGNAPAGESSPRSRLHKRSILLSNSGNPVMRPKLGLTRSSSSASLHSKVGKAARISRSRSFVSLSISLSIDSAMNDADDHCGCLSSPSIPAAGTLKSRHSALVSRHVDHCAARGSRDRGRPALERGQDALVPGTPRPQLPANADS